MKTIGRCRRGLVTDGAVVGLLAIATTTESAPVVINSMRRKLWGILLLLQVFWMPAVNAATYSGGSGTEADPYLISTSQDLVTLANTANSADWATHFLMTQDIDMSGVAGFTPIGNSTTAFTGIFDGGGHAIQNLTINLPAQTYVGLFARTYGACQFRNLGMQGGAVTGDQFVGALVGLNEFGTITTCYATGTVTGFARVGGLVGSNYGPVTACYTTGAVTGTDQGVGGLVGCNYSDTVTGCYANGAVTGTSMVGGLLGLNYATVTGCYATGAVSDINSGGGSGENWVGGLVGKNSGALMQCYATGAVTGVNYVGGLIGDSDGTLTACYTTGAVTGNNWVGGLVGYNGNMMMTAYPAVTGSYATGAVTGVGGYVGGLVGLNDVGGTVTASLWDIDASGQGGSSGGKGVTTVQMKTLTIFRNAGWGAYGWVMENGQYPRLAWEGTGASPIPAPEPVPLVGSGTESDPYRVGTVAEFALLSWHVAILDKHIQLTADLDCAGVALYPLGDLGLFTGVFGGGGHRIRNVTIAQPDSDYVGVFAVVVAGGSIHDLNVENVTITGKLFVGGLVGHNNGGSVTSCYATGAVAGGDYCVGGLIGVNDGGTVTGCYSTCAVTGNNNVGGLVGLTYQGMVTGCYAMGVVTGNDFVGGLVGTNVIGAVTDCYATGAVTGNDGIGGLVGNNGGTVRNCYATGAVTGATELGGLVGFLASGTVATSFWDIDVGGPDNGLGSGLHTGQMKQRATFESAGWDFTGPPPVWFIFEGQSYPYLFGLPIPVGSISGTLITASATQGKSADPKNCSVDILATDGNGNRVGSLYSGSAFTEDVNEIPNARYGGHGAFPNYIYVPWPIEVSALEFVPLCDGPFEYTIDIWTPVGRFYHHEEQLTASVGEHVSISVPEYPVLPVVSKIALVFFVVLMVGIGVRQTRLPSQKP